VQGPPEADAATAPASSSEAGAGPVAAPSSSALTQDSEGKHEKQLLPLEGAATTPVVQPDRCTHEPVLPPCTPPRTEAGSSGRSASLHV